MSDASRVVVRAREETVFGVTDSAALKTIRATGFTLKRATQGTTSQEIRDDRQIPDWVRTGVSVEGEIPFEFVYGNLHQQDCDFLAAAFGGAWATDTGLSGAAAGTDLLVNGVTPKSFVLEAEYADITQFHSYNGCRVNTLNLRIIPGAIITGSLGFMGKVDAIAGTTIGTGAASAAVTGTPMNAVDNVSAISEDGNAIELLEMNLSISNGLRQQPIIGSLGPQGIGYGLFNVTGNIRMYFADAALLTKYNAGTQTNLAFTTTDAAGNVYQFQLPAIKYTDFTKPNQGPEGDITATVPFQAFLDTVTGRTLRMTRNPA